MIEQGTSTHRLTRSFHLKIFFPMPIQFYMVNSISGANAPSTNEITQKAAPKPQPVAHAPANIAVPQDKATLKSTGDLAAGDPDHDGK